MRQIVRVDVQVLQRQPDAVEENVSVLAAVNGDRCARSPRSPPRPRAPSFKSEALKALCSLFFLMRFLFFSFDLESASSVIGAARFDFLCAIRWRVVRLLILRGSEDVADSRGLPGLNPTLEAAEDVPGSRRLLVLIIIRRVRTGRRAALSPSSSTLVPQVEVLDPQPADDGLAPEQVAQRDRQFDSPGGEQRGGRVEGGPFLQRPGHLLGPRRQLQARSGPPGPVTRRSSERWNRVPRGSSIPPPSRR